MKTKLSIIAVAAAVTLTSIAPAFASGENTSLLLGAGQATAVTKARAQGIRMRRGSSSSTLGRNAECASSNVDVGNVTIPRGARAPREVVTVITGDVINVNNGFGRAFCR